MKSFGAIALALLASAAPSLANVVFSSPAAGETIAVSGTTASITIAWTDGGDAPTFADIASAQLFLMSGSDENPTALYTGSTITSLSTTTSTVMSVDEGIGGDGYYFIKMLQTTTDAQTVVTYSPRFKLSGMTGVFDAVVSAGLASSETDTPSGTTPAALGGSSSSTAATADTSVTISLPMTFNLALQTGLTRTAPAIPWPQTKITAQTTDVAPLYPTSEYTVYTTYGAIPTIVTTITSSAPYTYEVAANAASVMPNPSVAGHHYKRDVVEEEGKTVEVAGRWTE
ncbi:Cell wall synthesis protein kre9 precursor [Saitoella coloradoensis]